MPQIEKLLPFKELCNSFVKKLIAEGYTFSSTLRHPLSVWKDINDAVGSGWVESPYSLLECMEDLYTIATNSDNSMCMTREEYFEAARDQEFKRPYLDWEL